MRDATILPDLIAITAERSPEALALTYAKTTIRYSELHDAVAGFAGGLLALGLQRADRVGIWLEKRFETVIASFGAPAPGACSYRSIRCSSRSRWLHLARLQRAGAGHLAGALALLPVADGSADLRHVV